MIGILIVLLGSNLGAKRRRDFKIQIKNINEWGDLRNLFLRKLVNFITDTEV